MKPTVPGPTYAEMLHPELLPSAVRERALTAAADELDPLNLFRITWRGSAGGVRHIVLPAALTGVEAGIIVMVGRDFPSGSHKVGPAYATLMEGELAGEISPEGHTVIGPSTGNFGIGVAYVSRLKGYPAIVIMPEGMSKERYARIRQYGGELDLTPGSESDVILVLERTELYKKDPKNKILAQFELLPNYRFHRYVTGRSALEAAQGQVVFHVRAGCTFEGPLFVGGGLVASLGRQEGALWLAAVDSASGRPRLARPLPLRAAGAPLYHRGRVVLGGVADGESHVLAYKLSGEEAWRATLGSSCGVPALSAHGGRVYASLRDGSVACVGAGGKLAWKVPGCGLELDHAALPIVRRGVLIAAGDPMRALDPATGALLCELPATQGLSALALGTPLDVFAIDDDGVAACFQLATHLSVVG